MAVRRVFVRLFPAVLLLGALLGASPANAAPWTVDYANSHLGFKGMQGSTAFDGGFKTFQAVINFDPAHPESGSITATIDTGSATAGSSERDSICREPDWFDVKVFPEAQFASTAIRATSPDKSGANCYEATGNLTIKGVTKPVKLPFCLKPENDHMRAEGRLTLTRTDFNLGSSGQWAADAFIRDAVEVMGSYRG